MSYTYLTAQQLAEKIQYDARTIRNQLKDSVFIGKHPANTALPSDPISLNLVPT